MSLSLSLAESKLGKIDTRQILKKPNSLKFSYVMSLSARARDKQLCTRIRYHNFRTRFLIPKILY